MADRPIDKSYWVIPDRFLASEYPGAHGAARARTKLELFLDAGVDFFVDLTEPDEGLEPYAELLRELGDARGVEVDHHRMAIVDGDIPSRELMKEILDLIDEALEQGRTVCVHCWGGVGRTGTTVGCFLVRRGSSGDAALHQVQKWFDTTPKHLRFSPETPTQARFVRDWRE
ncbi:MAG: dual specificity protein phosphatase family protein [Deltaproteobacteria bacterium]|jgi:hypothetical protein|nr:dual specificity protein phosphatase family protein [Deltaproteobacteria bacterium]MBW2535723.1 dual specificity protein phosphatase family protein [Deltaproteobacteria bacterium]